MFGSTLSCRTSESLGTEADVEVDAAVVGASEGRGAASGSVIVVCGGEEEETTVLGRSKVAAEKLKQNRYRNRYEKRRDEKRETGNVKRKLKIAKNKKGKREMGKNKKQKAKKRKSEKSVSCHPFFHRFPSPVFGLSFWHLAFGIWHFLLLYQGVTRYLWVSVVSAVVSHTTMVYCNNTALVLSAEGPLPTTPLLSKTSISAHVCTSRETLSPTISMSSLTSFSSTSTSTSVPTSVSSSGTTSALRHVLRSKKSSLYKPRKNDHHFDPADPRFNDFADTFSLNNSISTSSIPSLEIDSLSSSFTQSCLTASYRINTNDHPLFVDDEDEDWDNVIEKRQTSPQTVQLDFGESFMQYLKSKATQLYTHYTEKTIDIQYYTQTQQLETFKTTLCPINTYQEIEYIPTNSKPRESRINPAFLKFFAIYKSIKSSPLDDSSNSTVDFYYYEFIHSDFNDIDHFLDSFNITDSKLRTNIKFNILSRDKMYSNVILSPRKDMYQTIQTSKSNYTKLFDSNLPHGSLIRENGKVMPWHHHSLNVNTKKCFTPKGLLPNNTQYTVKNWENTRWVSE